MSDSVTKTLYLCSGKRMGIENETGRTFAASVSTSGSTATVTIPMVADGDTGDAETKITLYLLPTGRNWAERSKPAFSWQMTTGDIIPAPPLLDQRSQDQLRHPRGVRLALQRPAPQPFIQLAGRRQTVTDIRRNTRQ